MRLQPKSWQSRCNACRGKGKLPLHYSNHRGERYRSALDVECPHCDGGIMHFGDVTEKSVVLVDTGNGLCCFGVVPKDKAISYARSCALVCEAIAWTVQDIDGTVIAAWP